jgi:ABC-type multidrug transport system fused ATPase/permease subunit
MQAAKRFVLIVSVILAVLLIVGLILAAIFKVLTDVLYVFLIILALLMIGATLFQIYSIMALIRTIRTVRDEMHPLVASVQETIGIMKETAQTAGHTVSTIDQTTKLTSEFVLAPVIQTVSWVVAMRGMMRVFFGKGHVRSRAERRREQQLEAMRENREKGLK